jgi:hypothetical protein
VLRRRRSAPPDDHSGDDLIDRAYRRAREIDPEAWAERDRLWRARGANPDWLGQRPRSAAEKRMRERRAHALELAFDEDIVDGDAAIAEALNSLLTTARH